jgi:hypothetical protein
MTSHVGGSGHTSQIFVLHNLWFPLHILKIGITDLQQNHANKRIILTTKTQKAYNPWHCVIVACNFFAYAQ